MNKPINTPTTLEHYARYRLIDNGAIVGVGTRNDMERMTTEQYDNKGRLVSHARAGKIEFFAGASKF